MKKKIKYACLMYTIKYIQDQIQFVKYLENILTDFFGHK